MLHFAWTHAELRNSVQQQRELVEVSRAQLQSERDALELERKARIQAAQPLFVLTNDGANFSEPKRTYQLSIANAGSTVTSVVGTILFPDGTSRGWLNIGMFARSTQASGNLELVGPFPATGLFLRVAYLDHFGNDGLHLFHIKAASSAQNSLLQAAQVEA